MNLINISFNHSENLSHLKKYHSLLWCRLNYHITSLILDKCTAFWTPLNFCLLKKKSHRTYIGECYFYAPGTNGIVTAPIISSDLSVLYYGRNISCTKRCQLMLYQPTGSLFSLSIRGNGLGMGSDCCKHVFSDYPSQHPSPPFGSFLLNKSLLSMENCVRFRVTAIVCQAQRFNKDPLSSQHWLLY